MKKFFMSIALLAAAILGAQAQGWEKIPVDENVRVGHLDNGLTYYIRHNELPKQRAEFHIAQAVGAVLEEDDQNGLAHFLEHMCFNGTEHFPGKGIINYFESVGVNFGGNINAYTSIDKTVYRLSEVPTYREGIIDSALLVMHDWSCAVSLLPEEIDNERGVIREEWRTGATAARRMYKESNRLMFPGSQYAKRDVIGDTAVINNFSYDALRAYYHKWYGPDLQAIIVVGDIDVDQIEAKIKALWADVPARKNRGERPWHSVADNDEPIVAIVQDAEAQQSRIRLIYKHDQLPKEAMGTNAQYIMNLMNSLIVSMMDERFQEDAMKADASFLGGGTYYGELVKQKDAFNGIVIPKEGQERHAWHYLLTQMEKMRRYGFTSDELERAKTAMLASYEKSYNERSATRNISYVNEYIGNFLEDEVIPGIEWEYNFVKTVLPQLPVGAINQYAVQLVSDKNIIVNIQAPLKETVDLPSEEQIKNGLAGMEHLDIERPVEKEIITTLVEKEPKAGKVKKQKQNSVMGTTEWTLKNGVKVIFKPTQFKQDEILMEGFSNGGLSLVKTEDLPSATLATDIIEYSGLGQFSITDLQKALTGKVVSISPSISQYSESLSGSSSVKDFETLLQLNYLYFTALRKDDEAYQTLMGMLDQQLLNKEKNPKAIWSDSVRMMTGDYSDRIVMINKETMAKVNQDKAISIFKERFQNPRDFVYTFTGNIDPTDPQTKALIQKWLGGLKTKRGNESWKDNGIRAPKGEKKNYFTRDMQIKTASNRIQFSSYDIPYTLENELNMEMIGRILSTRYLESIREREGGSYGVGCGGWMGKKPVESATLVMQFDTDPEKQARLIQIIYDEVNEIIANGPLASDLQKEKESMLKDFKEDVEKNSWWHSEALPNYYRLGIDLLNNYEAAVNAITAESVQKLLKKLVESGNVFEVVMLPE
ncbi:MAG: insulinase family protein [Bacteroidales bacterium]|nr:insulinase family protein [Candidatus Colicola faecequi]